MFRASGGALHQREDLQPCNRRIKQGGYWRVVAPFSPVPPHREQREDEETEMELTEEQLRKLLERAWDMASLAERLGMNEPALAENEINGLIDEVEE